MKLNLPSFVLGVGVTMAGVASRHRIRPVVVELSALGIHLARIGRGIIGRTREDVEDLWAEIDERVRQRETGAAARARRPLWENGTTPATESAHGN